MKVDTTQWQRNRYNFSRLYQSLRNVYIPHQDILMMVGNPYAETIRSWKNIPEARRQIIRKEYPEMDVTTAAYLKWEAEHVRISNINEGIDDVSLDFAMFATGVKGIVNTATTAWKLFFSRKITTTAIKNAPKIEKVANDVLTEAERKGFRGIRRKIELRNFNAYGVEQKRRNIARTINGKDYSAHILDQMQNRGIGHLAVENAIRTGIKRVSKKFPETCSEFYDKVNKITVVVNNTTGKRVTVYFE